MSTARRAVGNSLVLLVSQAITWTATLVLTAALGWYLGDVGFGDLYLAVSFGLIFSVLVEFGLNQQVVRAVARDKTLAGSYLVNSLAIKAVLGGLAYGAILVLAWALGYTPQQRLIIAVYCLILFANSAVTSFTAIYQAAQRVVYPAIGTIIEKVLVCLVALALLALGYGVVAVAVVSVVGAVANALWQGVCLGRLVPAWERPDQRVIRTLIVGALPFFLYWVLGAVYYRVDTILLSKLTDPATVGWYGAAYRLFDTLVFLPSIVSSAIMFPILAKLSLVAREELRVALGKGLNVMLIVGLPLCVGLFTLAEPIIRFIYRRPEFLNAVPALRWLALALLLLYLNSMLAVVLVSLNAERKMTLAAGLAVGVNLGLNWLLIPQYGHIAAAAVTAGTEAFLFGYLLIVLPRDVLLPATLLVAAKALVAAGAMALVLVVLGGWPLPLLVVVGGATYAAVGLLVRLVPPEDLRVVQQTLLARGRGRALDAEAAQA